MIFIKRTREGDHGSASTRGVRGESDLDGLAGFVDLERVSVKARKG